MKIRRYNIEKINKNEWSGDFFLTRKQLSGLGNTEKKMLLSYKSYFMPVCRAWITKWIGDNLKFSYRIGQ